MALNIEKLKERLAQLNSKGNGGSSMGFLTIADGRNVLRVLPALNDDDFFYKEVYVHYGVGKTEQNPKGTMVVCPTTDGDGKPCPVCQLSKAYKDASKAKDDQYDKESRSLWRKKRVYYNAIGRDENLSDYKKNSEGKWVNAKGEEENPVKVLGTGVGILKDILGIICDPEYGDITDPEKGLDLIITKSGTGFNTNYDVKTVRKESPIGFEFWKECLNDLAILAKYKTYSEIEAIVNGEETPAETPASTSTTESSDTSAKEDTTKENTSEGGSSETLEDEIKKALKLRQR